MTKNNPTIYVAGTSRDLVHEEYVDGTFRKRLLIPEIVDTPYGKLTNSAAEVRGMWILAHDVTKADNDIVGFEHYRRFFIQHTLPYEPQKNKHKFNLLNADDVANIFADKEITNDNVDAVVCPVYIDRTNILAKMLTSDCCRVERGQAGAAVLHFLMSLDLDTSFKETAAEYLTQDKLYGHNMIICRHEILRKYMQWLIPLWFRFSKDSVYASEKYCPYALGYISEMMLGAWLIHNNYNLFEAQRIVYTKDLDELTSYQQTKLQASARLRNIYACKHPNMVHASLTASKNQSAQMYFNWQ